MVLPHLDILVFAHHSAIEVQRGRGGVKVDLLDADCQRGVHAGGGDTPRGGLGDKLADGRGGQMVPLHDQVVGMPHIFGLFWIQCH